MLIAKIEMAKIELTGGHIGFMLIIDMTPYWNYANYREKKNTLAAHYSWNYANYRDCQNRINWRPH